MTYPSSEVDGRAQRSMDDSVENDSMEDDATTEHRNSVDDELRRHRHRTPASQAGTDRENGSSSSTSDDSEPEPTLDGLRGFVHASVDSALDVAESLVKIAGGLLNTLTTTARQTTSYRSESPSPSDTKHADPGLLLLDMNPGSPGSSVTGRMEVINSTRDFLDSISPKCDVLVGTGGRSIPGHSVTFVPRIADVKPHTNQQFTVTIAIPDSTKRGTYSGLITVVGHPAVRLLVHLDVN